MWVPSLTLTGSLNHQWQWRDRGCREGYHHWCWRDVPTWTVPPLAPAGHWSMPPIRMAGHANNLTYVHLFKFTLKKIFCCLWKMQKYSNVHKNILLLDWQISHYINNNIKQKLFRISLNLREINDEIKIGMSRHSYNQLCFSV